MQCERKETKIKNLNLSRTDGFIYAFQKPNRTGPPCSVGRPTADAPGPAAADHPRASRPARPPAALQTTTTDDKRQRAKEY